MSAFKSDKLNYSAMPSKMKNATPMTAATTNYQDESSIYAGGAPDLDLSPDKNQAGK